LAAPEAIFFAGPAELRAWLDDHHADRDEVDVGFYKKAVRFMPRREGSNWSEPNVARVEALDAEGRMAAVGRAAFEARDGCG
jgi:hypothetical protein